MRFPKFLLAELSTLPEVLYIWWVIPRNIDRDG